MVSSTRDRNCSVYGMQGSDSKPCVRSHCAQENYASVGVQNLRNSRVVTRPDGATVDASESYREAHSYASIGLTSAGLSDFPCPSKAILPLQHSSRSTHKGWCRRSETNVRCDWFARAGGCRCSTTPRPASRWRSPQPFDMELPSCSKSWDFATLRVWTVGTRSCDGLNFPVLVCSVLPWYVKLQRFVTLGWTLCAPAMSSKIDIISQHNDRPTCVIWYKVTITKTQ